MSNKHAIYVLVLIVLMIDSAFSVRRGREIEVPDIEEIMSSSQEATENKEELTEVRRRMMSLIDEYFPTSISCKELKSDSTCKIRNPAEGKKSPNHSLLTSWSLSGKETACGFVVGQMLRKLFPEKAAHVNRDTTKFRDIAWKGLMAGGTGGVPSCAKALHAFVENRGGDNQALPKPGDIFFLRNPKYPSIGRLMGPHHNCPKCVSCCYKEGCHLSNCRDNVEHVGIVGKVSPGLWITYDGGQGNAGPPRVERAKAVERIPGTVSVNVRGESRDLMCLHSEGAAGESKGCKVIGGWIDLDKLDAALEDEIDVDKYPDDPDEMYEQIEEEMEGNDIGVAAGSLQPS
jgi:hypothetical protein